MLFSLIFSPNLSNFLTIMEHDTVENRQWKAVSIKDIHSH